MYIEVKVAVHEATKHLYDLLLHNVVHTIECSDFLKSLFVRFLASKCAKSVTWAYFFCKNADFNADFESVEKLQKSSCEYNSILHSYAVCYAPQYKKVNMNRAHCL